MPIYEYLCSKCQIKFEAIRSIKDADSPISCKNCNSKDTHRVLSLCYSKGESHSSTSSSGCSSCHGGSCSSCSH